MLNPLGKEVSCIAFETLNLELLRMGIPVAPLFEGLGLKLSDLGIRGARADWDVFVDYLDRVKDALKTHGGFDSLSRNVQVARGNETLAAIARTVATPQLILWIVAKWFGRAHFRNIQFTYELLSDGRVRMEIIIPQPYRDSIPFFEVWRQGFRGSPRTLGLPDAKVVAEIAPRKATYWVSMPSDRSIWSPLRRRWRILSGARAAVNELSDKELELRHYWAMLSDSQKRELEQQEKLQISSELASLSRMSALGEMAGGVAHEINNPLAIVLLCSGQLKQGLRNGNLDLVRAKKSIDQIEANSLRIADIVKSLKLFARDTGNNPFVPTEVSSIFHGILNLSAEKCRNLGIRLEMPKIQEDLRISCRAEQLMQVLLNCITNSCEAIAHLDEKWIRLETYRQGKFAVIAVVDSGRGIDPNLRERLFEPFFTTKKIGMGTGLGLSIAKGIIEAHGGIIGFDFESQNTRIVIHLPLEKDKPTMT